MSGDWDCGLGGGGGKVVEGVKESGKGGNGGGKEGELGNGKWGNGGV